MHRRQSVEEGKLCKYIGRRDEKFLNGITHIRVAVNNQGQSCVADTSKTESEKPATNHGQDPMHTLMLVRFHQDAKKKLVFCNVHEQGSLQT